MWPRLASSALWLVLTLTGGPDSPPAAPRFSFMPNQLAANVWYKPGPEATVINGHLDESFGRAELWPRLRARMGRLRGSFSCGAAEVGWLSSRDGLLPLLGEAGLGLAVELPGFTQDLDGATLAAAELNGSRLPDGANLFARTFRLDKPDGHGWFVTRDGQPLLPDEILFDERVPNLLPRFDAAKLAGPGPWEARKQAARIDQAASTMNQSFAANLDRLMGDYVAYLRVARAKWGDRMPAVSLHWNVNPGWEWRDEPGLDAVVAADPDWFSRPDAFRHLIDQRPQFNSVRYLSRLLDRLTAAGFRPRTVYMDVDWTYDVAYVKTALLRHAADLRARGVQMGINVVEASLGANEALRFTDHTLVRQASANAPPNQLYEATLLAIADFLRDAGLDAPDIQWRVGSWSRRPGEVGGEVDETRPGSLAHTALVLADRL